MIFLADKKQQNQQDQNVYGTGNAMGQWFAFTAIRSGRGIGFEVSSREQMGRKKHVPDALVESEPQIGFSSKALAKKTSNSCPPVRAAAWDSVSDIGGSFSMVAGGAVRLRSVQAAFLPASGPSYHYARPRQRLSWGNRLCCCIKRPKAANSIFLLPVRDCP